MESELRNQLNVNLHQYELGTYHQIIRDHINFEIFQKKIKIEKFVRFLAKELIYHLYLQAQKP